MIVRMLSRTFYQRILTLPKFQTQNLLAKVIQKPSPIERDELQAPAYTDRSAVCQSNHTLSTEIILTS